MAAPLIWLYGNAFVKLLFTGGITAPSINLALFGRSLAISFYSTALCAVLGMLIAIFLWNLSPSKARFAFMLLLISALIPPFIHVHSWIKTIDYLNGILQSTFHIGANFTGVGAVIWTTAMSYLPFTSILVFLGLQSIPEEVLELVQLDGHPVKVFLKVLLPFALNYLLVSGLFIFLLTINDFSIATVFGVNVYALEIFALFSAGGDLYGIALSALPLIVLAVGLMLFISYLTKNQEFKANFANRTHPLTESVFMHWVAGAGGLVLVAFTSVPIMTMIIESFHASGLPGIVRDSVGQIVYSFAISFLTAVLAVLPATFYGYLRTQYRHGRLLTFLLAFPFLIPSAILGLSIISVWNHGALSTVYTSALMPAIGLATRFGILAILYMSFCFERIDRDLSDAMRLDFFPIAGFLRIILPMVRRDIFACLLLIFALSMGEYGIVLLITPPGYQMITIKIYNYIHYGSAEIVFALNLIIFLTIVSSGLMLMRLFRNKDDVGAVV